MTARADEDTTQPEARTSHVAKATTHIHEITLHDDETTPHQYCRILLVVERTLQRGAAATIPAATLDHFVQMKIAPHSEFGRRSCAGIDAAST